MALAIWSCIVFGGGRAAVTLHHLVWNKKNVYLCCAQNLLLQLTIERIAREMFIHY